MNYAILEQPDGKYKIICYQDGKKTGCPLYCQTWNDVIMYLNMINRGVAA